MNGINGIKSLTVQFFSEVGRGGYILCASAMDAFDGGGESPLGMVQACDWDGKLAILLGQGVKIQPRAYAKASVCLKVPCVPCVPCVQASGESTVQKEPSEVPVTSQTSQITRSGFRHVLLNFFALPNDAYDAPNGFRGSTFIQRT